MKREDGDMTIRVPLMRGALFAALMVLLALSLPRLANAASHPPEEGQLLTLSYSIALGGFHVGAANIEARFGGGAYGMEGRLKTDGFIERFFKAVYELESEGGVEESQLRPDRFRSLTLEPDRRREVVLRYGKDGLARMQAEPPYEDGYGPGLFPAHRKDTLDPLSALLLPIAEGADPCNRVLPVFDGRRRYDLRLRPDGETATAKIGSYQGKLTRCKITVIPRGGERKAVLEALKREDSIRVWLAPAEGGRIWVPLRITLRTPLGSAVALATDFQTAHLPSAK